jgi:hypothetical protein
MDSFGVFPGRLVSSLLPIDIYVAILVYFYPLGLLYEEKSGNPDLNNQALLKKTVSNKVVEFQQVCYVAESVTGTVKHEQ